MKGEYAMRVTGCLLFLCIVMLAIWTLGPNAASAQTKTPQSGTAVTAEQQKQLDRLTQLREQLRKDEDSVDFAVHQYGWDSNEADAAQQRLLEDRREYRSLRESLQAGGVNIPSDMWGAGMCAHCNQMGSSRSGRGYHGCCDGARNYAADKGCCCGGRGY